MRLRSQNYLSDAGSAARKRRTRAGWLQPDWVLPRAWCVTASLQAKGVPRHKTAAFAQLHLARLAPFADSGVFACRAGDWVHFWFWENQRVRDLCARHGLTFGDLRLIPESLCFPRLRQGATLQRAAEGVEAQLWQDNQLVDSAWWPQVPDAATWDAWRPTAAASVAGRAAAWPEAPPPLSGLGVLTSADLRQPWANNLFGQKWTAGLRELRSSTFFIIAGGLVAGLAAYWGAQWLALHGEQAEVDQQIAALSAQVEPINAARGKTLQLLQWTGRIARLNQQDDLDGIFKALRPVLAKENAVLREFEYNDGELRFVLVPSGGDIDLAALIRRVEGVPVLRELRLLPDSDARLVRLSAKVRRPDAAGTETEPAAAGAGGTLAARGQ